ncbi:MAG: DEAD/DEAH box helicase [Bacteroidales bacterium]|nr:DEAD/DEAH box helicase [Bacteroidales bacterium]
MTFENLKLIEPILRALKHEGYTTPTPIQAEAIPLVLNRRDILGCAQTGTGKTAAFAIPMIQLLSQERNSNAGKRPIKALILTPTRELAIQIDESFTSYGRHTSLRHHVIFGGVNQNSQVNALRNGLDILVATPGRLLDLMNQRHVNLDSIQFFVLDEADRMLDMGFVNDVKKVLARLPLKRQSLFFSATMPPAIIQLADTILVNPAKVSVTPVSSTVDAINQSVYFVDKKNKKNLLIEVLKGDTIDRALVFTRTKHGADKVSRDLSRAGILAEAIHGNKSQNARQKALSNFKSRQTRVLVATDIAARGIDIDDLSHVINFELPNMPESYVHRIGRTGRAGANGSAIAFCDAEEKEYLRDIQRLIGQQIPEKDNLLFPLMNHTVTKAAPRQNRSQRSNGNRNGYGRSYSNGR